MDFLELVDRFCTSFRAALHTRYHGCYEAYGPLRRFAWLAGAVHRCRHRSADYYDWNGLTGYSSYC